MDIGPLLQKSGEEEKGTTPKNSPLLNVSQTISDEVDDGVATSISTSASCSAFSPNTTFSSSKSLQFLAENQPPLKPKTSIEDVKILQLDALMPDLLSQEEVIYAGTIMATDQNNKETTEFKCRFQNSPSEKFKILKKDFFLNGTKNWWNFKFLPFNKSTVKTNVSNEKFFPSLEGDLDYANNNELDIASKNTSFECCCCYCFEKGILHRLFGTKIRYLILLITVLCMAASRSNELAFNFTVICMTANSSVNNDPPLPMEPGEISAVFAAGGAGAIIMVLPIVYLLHYLGPRLVFSTLMIISSLATFCLPTLARIAPIWMVFARLLQGLCLSAVLPLMGWISAQWAAQIEIGKFMTFLSSSGQLSQILTMPLSAHLCITSGWSSVFYVHAGISTFLAVLFFAFYRNSPKNHPCIKHEELKYITSGVRPIKKEPVPHMKILKSKAVWAIWIAFLGNSFGFQLIVQFMPTFLNKVLGVPIARTGIAAIIPPIAQLLVKIVTGGISDTITCISELRKLQLFNSLAMIGCGIFLLPLGYLSNNSESQQHTTTQLIALLCFTASISCLGMVASGSMKSATLVARNFTHFIMAVVQLLVCVGMLLVPILVNWLAPNNAINEWRRLFFVVFFILFSTNIIFCRFCSANAAPWAVNKFQGSPTTNHSTENTMMDKELSIKISNEISITQKLLVDQKNVS